MKPDESPPPPQQDPGDNGDEWRWEIGACWLYCLREEVPVLWLGSVASSGSHAPLFACLDCIHQLNAKVWQWLLGRDGTTRQPAPGQQGRP